MGFGTKNCCAGEGQKKFTIQPEATDFSEEYVASMKGVFRNIG
jgi:hypothetical protein